jgi:ABC-2 type transport system permease protein
VAALFLYLNTRNWFVVAASVIIAGALIVGFYFFKRDVFSGFIQKFLSWFSLNKRYDYFSMGLLKLENLFYYASFCGLFLFLTVRLIEKRRWN